MTVNVRLVGDINLKRDLDFDPEVALRLAAPELRAADLRLGNLEGCFSDPRIELPYKPGWFHCEPEGADQLPALVDAVACANNVHYGPAIVESLQRLDGLGIAHTGAGCDRDVRADRVPADDRARARRRRRADRGRLAPAPGAGRGAVRRGRHPLQPRQLRVRVEAASRLDAGRAPGAAHGG